MWKEMYNIMSLLNDFMSGFLDNLAGHLALTAFMLAVTDERAVWRRLKKLPLLLLAPLVAALLSVLLYAVPELGMLQYLIYSFAVLIMYTVWVRWAWQFGFWRAFAATCMARIFQVAVTTLSGILFWIILPDEDFRFIAAIGLHLSISITAALLLHKLRFGKCFRLLLDDETAIWRTALLLFALETTMEMFYYLLNGIQSQYLLLYYLLLLVMVVLMAVLVAVLV
ncbi:MAG: GHKL domain-containing protein, partial [Acetatifactor sp.]|nr:GHKL domain-containing protein [Acetatifactor sp.]